MIRPHHKSFRKRLRKRPRLHFLDTGLVCDLLGIQSPDLLERHPLRGAIFEQMRYDPRGFLDGLRLVPGDGQSVDLQIHKCVAHAGRAPGRGRPLVLRWRYLGSSPWFASDCPPSGAGSVRGRADIALSA